MTFKQSSRQIIKPACTYSVPGPNQHLLLMVISAITAVVITTVLTMTITIITMYIVTVISVSNVELGFLSVAGTGRQEAWQRQ